MGVNIALMSLVKQIGVKYVEFIFSGKNFLFKNFMTKRSRISGKL